MRLLYFQMCVEKQINLYVRIKVKLKMMQRTEFYLLRKSMHLYDKQEVFPIYKKTVGPNFDFYFHLMTQNDFQGE